MIIKALVTESGDGYITIEYRYPSGVVMHRHGSYSYKDIENSMDNFKKFVEIEVTYEPREV